MAGAIEAMAQLARAVPMRGTAEVVDDILREAGHDLAALTLGALAPCLLILAFVIARLRLLHMRRQQD